MLQGFEDYKVEGTEDVYYPMGLPLRTTVKLKNLFGKRVITKYFLNCLDLNIRSWSIYTDFGISDLKVVTLINGKPDFCKVSLRRNMETKEYFFQVYIGNLFYKIVEIDGKDPLEFAPHVEVMINEGMI